MHLETKELQQIAQNYLAEQGFIEIDDYYGGYQRENIENGNIIYLGSYADTGLQSNNSALLIWVSDCDRMHEQESVEITNKKQLEAMLSILCFLID